MGNRIWFLILSDSNLLNIISKKMILFLLVGITDRTSKKLMPNEQRD